MPLNDKITTKFCIKVDFYHDEWTENLKKCLTFYFQ